MTEKRPRPDETAGTSRRKTTAPTIDLKATEVKPEVKAGPSGDPARDKPPVQEPPGNTPPAKEPPVQDPAKDPPVKEPPKPKPQPAEPERSSSLAAPPRSGMAGTALAAGVVGALVMSLVGAGLWFAGIVTMNDGASNAQVAALEKQVQELQNRPAPGAANDSKSVAAIDARVAKMENALKNLPAGDSSALSERVSAADNAMKSLGVALTALNHRSEEIAGKAAAAQQRADAAEKAVSDLRASVQDVSKTANAGASSAELEPLQKRIDALEQQARNAQTQISKATASDKSARRALSAVALREAVTRGAPFSAELAQAKLLGADDQLLSALTPFAATGVPGEKQLSQELRALLPALQKAAGSPAATGGFIDRLQANAEQLVRIRPVDAPPGDDPSAVLARIEVDAAHDNVAAALADLAKLPEKMRAPAQGWIAKAQNRQAALAGARQFAASSALALGPK
jgi:hypothetical protein